MLCAEASEHSCRYSFFALDAGAGPVSSSSSLLSAALRPESPLIVILSTLLLSLKVVADDTTLPVLDPGRGRTKTGRPWTSYGLSSVQLGLGRTLMRARSNLGCRIAPCSCRPGRFAASWTALARGALPAGGRDGGMSYSVEQRDGHGLCSSRRAPRQIKQLSPAQWNARQFKQSISRNP